MQVETFGNSIFMKSRHSTDETFLAYAVIKKLDFLKALLAMEWVKCVMLNNVIYYYIQ